MGGSGSGYWRRKKRRVEDCLFLDVNRFKQQLDGNPGTSGTLTWTGGAHMSFEVAKQGGGIGLVVSYSTGGDSQSYFVPATPTRPHFGGRRWWFVCPNRKCGRRVGKLYLPRGEQYFLCRHCHNLTYKSRQDGKRKGLFDFWF